MHLLELIHLAMLQFSSAQFSRSVVSNSLRSCESQHTRPPCPSPAPRVHPTLQNIKSVYMCTHTHTHTLYINYINMYIYIIFLHIRNEQSEIEILKPVSLKIDHPRASLVAQWKWIWLPTQETWVQFLLSKDPTFCKATKPMCHHYWACALEPRSYNYCTHIL